MRAINRPLKDALDIDYFSYQRVERSGKYAFLSNFPEYIQFYMDKSFYNLDSSLIHPDFYPCGETVLLVNNDIFNKSSEPLNRLLQECQKHFDFWQTIQLTHKTADGVYESFCFSTKSRQHNLLQNYVNELGLFRRFIAYFKNQSSPSLSHELSQYGMDLAEMKGSEFKKVDSKIAANLKRAKDVYFPGEDLSESTEKEAFLALASQLTDRERESLRWVVNGKTAYEVGIILGISQRTVESHLNNALKKLGMGTNRTSIAYLVGKHGLQL